MLHRGRREPRRSKVVRAVAAIEEYISRRRVDVLNRVLNTPSHVRQLRDRATRVHQSAGAAVGDRSKRRVDLQISIRLRVLQVDVAARRIDTQRLTFVVARDKGIRRRPGDLVLSQRDRLGLIKDVAGDRNIFRRRYRYSSAILYRGLTLSRSREGSNVAVH